MLSKLYEQTYPRLRKVKEIIVLDVDAQRSIPLSADTDGLGTAYMINGFIQFMSNPEILFCLTVAHSKYHREQRPSPWLIEAVNDLYLTQLNDYCSKNAS